MQVVKSFRTFDGEELLTPAWGYSVKKGANSISHGLWLRLKATPVLKPWQAPRTWGELRTACREQEVDLDVLLREALGLLKDKEKMGRIALIGFPVPSVFEGTLERMHWLALYLPDLVGTDNQVKGFRPGKKWSWQHNRDRLMHDSATVRCLDSENWFPDQLQTRGCLGTEMTSKKILMLGAGALGSMISELIVRGGMHHMLILDSDHLKAGNLVRHTLGLDDLNKEKAEAVAERLNNISPFAQIESITEHFPPTHPALVKQVNDSDMVVDCTGSDELLFDLSSFPWKGDRLFFSFSFGLGARRGFCLAARGERLPQEMFRQLIEPWLRKELEENAESQLPREGIGCWHPVFPARADDVWLMASAMVKYFEQTALAPPSEPELTVFEQVVDIKGVFSGIRKVSGEGP